MNRTALVSLLVVFGLALACDRPLPGDDVGDARAGEGGHTSRATAGAPATGGAPAAAGASGATGVPAGRGGGGGTTNPLPLPPPPSAGAGAGGSGGAAGKVSLTDFEWPSVMLMSPLPALPPDTTNRYGDDPAAALLGQRLFFDASYANPSPGAGGVPRLSCASCHRGAGLSDPAPEVAMTMSAYGAKRNALGLVNASHYRWVNWGGRFASQWELPLAVAENPNILASSRLQIVHLLFDRYRADYEAIFEPLDPKIGTDLMRFPMVGKPKSAGAPDGAWELMSETDRNTVNRAFVNYGKSVAAYLRRLVSTRSRFDDFVAGDRDALSGIEIAGLKLFIGRGGCNRCHVGAWMSDDSFHSLPVKPTTPDLGRFDDLPALLASPFNVDGVYSDDRATGRLGGLTILPAPELQGRFRTPTLRNVEVTAPYMHNGTVGSLEAAVQLHTFPASATSDPLATPVALQPDDIAALVAFLRSLTAAPLPPGLLIDTSR